LGYQGISSPKADGGDETRADTGLLHAVVTVCPVSKLLYFTFGFRFKLIASQAYSL